MVNININNSIFEIEDFEFKTGDVLKIITKGKASIVNVLSVTNKDNIFTVKIDTSKLDGQNVLIYGKQINDFKTIDYGQLVTLSIGAMQVMMEQISDLKDQLQKLQNV
jgi:hypothetical protein